MHWSAVALQPALLLLAACQSEGSRIIESVTHVPCVSTAHDAIADQMRDIGQASNLRFVDAILDPEQGHFIIQLSRPYAMVSAKYAGTGEVIVVHYNHVFVASTDRERQEIAEIRRRVVATVEHVCRNSGAPAPGGASDRA